MKKNIIDINAARYEKAYRIGRIMFYTSLASLIAGSTGIATGIIMGFFGFFIPPAIIIPVSSSIATASIPFFIIGLIKMVKYRKKLKNFYYASIILDNKNDDDIICFEKRFYF